MSNTCGGVMSVRFVFSLCVVFVLSSCAVSSDTETPICFASESEARKVGRKIYDKGFNHRVSYWVTGNSEKTIVGLGLKWGGFSPTDFCPQDQFPVLVLYDQPKDSPYDKQVVLKWANFVFRQMHNDMKTSG
ncbi:hypothetical protein CWE24_07655 [Pseudidiomarina donghaiensis]|uniref:Uncharacterized protein n=1 Tax=Pseudidiomarina donghaiensis TaxID=519452 RepID=A0A432XGG0_9GAMM|nr:hypothetical protein CWE24_07655 [Pseudidiomarina donghaiensis]